MVKLAGKPPVQIYVNKIQKRITSKIKSEYYLNPRLKNTEQKITKDNGENVSHLEITEVVLIHCNIFNNQFQHGSRILSSFA